MTYRTSKLCMLRYLSWSVGQRVAVDLVVRKNRLGQSVCARAGGMGQDGCLTRISRACPPRSVQRALRVSRQ